jgi:hypothetical protein
MSKHTPDELKSAKSPFIESLRIPVYYMTKTETLSNLNNMTVDGDVITSTGPTTSLNRKYIVEKDRKISMYYENNETDLRDDYMKLSKEGRLLLEYIKLYSLRENKLYFYLDQADFMIRTGITSRTTLWSCKKDLINSSFIAATSCTSWFWINPKYLFRGERSKCIEMKGNLITKEL